VPAGSPRFKLEDPKHLRIAARRLGRQRGTVGFGNARAVRNLLEWAIKRQSARVLQQRKQGVCSSRGSKVCALIEDNKCALQQRKQGLCNQQRKAGVRAPAEAARCMF